MSNNEGDSETREAVEQPPQRATEATQRESMGAAVDHLERTRAQAAHQSNTENRLPKATTKALGRPEIVGDGGKVLVKGAEPSQLDASKINPKDGPKEALKGGEQQASAAQVHNPLNAFFAGRMEATSDQAQKVMNAAQSGDLTADEAMSQLKDLTNEMGKLKDQKGASRDTSTSTIEATGTAPKAETGGGLQSDKTTKEDDTTKQDDSSIPTPSKELMDAYGSIKPDDLWKQMGDLADKLDGLPAGPDKDAMARQYNDMNTVYQYLRSRE